MKNHLNEKMKEKTNYEFFFSFNYFFFFFFFLGRISSFYFDTSFLIFKTKKGQEKIQATTYKVGGGTMPLGRSR